MRPQVRTWGPVRVCSSVQVRFRSEFLLEFTPEPDPKHAQDPFSTQNAAAPDMWEPVFCRNLQPVEGSSRVVVGCVGRARAQEGVSSAGQILT